jgi:hypothetical protein
MKKNIKNIWRLKKDAGKQLLEVYTIRKIYNKILLAEKLWEPKTDN